MSSLLKQNKKVIFFGAHGEPLTEKTSLDALCGFRVEISITYMYRMKTVMMTV